MNDISDITISEDEVMVSFDVISLFTAISVDKACMYIKTKLQHDGTLLDRTQLDIDDIIRLLKFILSNSFFIHNNTTYKQIHGCAMGSPVSAIVANLCIWKSLKSRPSRTLQHHQKFGNVLLTIVLPF